MKRFALILFLLSPLLASAQTAGPGSADSNSQNLKAIGLPSNLGTTFSGSGLVKASSGSSAVATAGTDYVQPGSVMLVHSDDTVTTYSAGSYSGATQILKNGAALNAAVAAAADGEWAILKKGATYDLAAKNLDLGHSGTISVNLEGTGATIVSQVTGNLGRLTTGDTTGPCVCPGLNSHIIGVRITPNATQSGTIFQSALGMVKNKSNQNVTYGTVICDGVTLDGDSDVIYNICTSGTMLFNNGTVNGKWDDVYGSIFTFVATNSTFNCIGPSVLASHTQRNIAQEFGGTWTFIGCTIVTSTTDTSDSDCIDCKALGVINLYGCNLLCTGNGGIIPEIVQGTGGVCSVDPTTVYHSGSPTKLPLWSKTPSSSFAPLIDATATSANLRALLTDEVGTGVAYFVGGDLGTPAGINLTNGSSLPLSGLSGLASGISTWLGTPSGANFASALTSPIPTTAGGTGVNGSATYPTSGTVLTTTTLPNATALMIFGDGSDSNVTISSGTTTLTRDMYYNNLTITGGTLNPGSYRVFVKGTLTLDSAPANAIAYSGAAGQPGDELGTHGSVAAAKNGSTAGGGGIGTNGADVGSAGVGTGAQAAANNASGLLGGKAGSGGKGGTGSNGAGGASRAASSMTNVIPLRRIQTSPHIIQVPGAGGTTATVLNIGGGSGGPGGSAGTGDGANTAGGGGAGGGGGGVIMIFANAISRTSSTATGAIAAKGGAAGAGGSPSLNGLGNVGGGGGGAGGGGGWVYIVYGSISGTTATNAIDTTGGAGAAGGNGFGASGTGGDGGGGGYGGRTTLINASAGTISETDNTTTAGGSGGSASGTTGGTAGAGTSSQVSL